MSNFRVPVDLVDKIWPLLSGIRALVVMDGRPGSGHYASFGAGDLSSDPNNGDAYFGLSEFISTLTSPTPHFTRVWVTKAHRDTPMFAEPRTSRIFVSTSTTFPVTTKSSCSAWPVPMRLTHRCRTASSRHWRHL